MLKFKCVAQVNSTREQLEYAIDAFLRERGWKSVIINPGAYYVLTKLVNGQEIMANKGLALGIEDSLDQERCECTSETDCDGCPVHDFEIPI